MKHAMPLGRKIAITGAVTALALVGFWLYRQSAASRVEPPVELVRTLPPDATTVIYLDLAALRQSPMLASLRALAPSPQADAEYAEFVRETGFDYERDLDRAAIATVVRGGTRILFAVADGRFDARKITAQALRTGTRETRGGREIFTAPISGSARKITFAFLKKDRIALTDGGDLGPLFSALAARPADGELEERALRLAGSPVFAVLHPEPGTLAALAARIPGGLRSEQLVALAGSLRWITLAARPEGEQTRIVVEGEALSEDAPRQLAGLLENLLLLARLALDDPKARARLDPAERAALVETLKSADVSRLDRGDTKAVRLMLFAGPGLLAALQDATPHATAVAPLPATSGATAHRP
ncbi:MAG: hypothetical protein LAN84_02870 [Acidobacteriia bacterium]|nr:hypothetical protein [Terriglobia bacterium]